MSMARKAMMAAEIMIRRNTRCSFLVRGIQLESLRRGKVVHFTFLVSVRNNGKLQNFALGILWENGAGKVDVFEGDILENQHFAEFPVGSEHGLSRALFRAVESGVLRCCYRLSLV